MPLSLPGATKWSWIECQQEGGQKATTARSGEHVAGRQGRGLFVVKGEEHGGIVFMVWGFQKVELVRDKIKYLTEANSKQYIASWNWV